MFQRTQIIGRLGRDPEKRYTPAGQAVTSFQVATDRTYADSNNKQVKETSWFRVQVWGETADLCDRVLKEGMLVMVEGRLVCDSKTGGPKVWKGEDNLAHANFEIVGSQVKFLTPLSTIMEIRFRV